MDVHGGSTVFLLGAGFSRAVSEMMPDMATLGQSIARRCADDSSLRRLLNDAELAAIHAQSIPLGNVEVWLSSLGTEQPFLTEAQNLSRRALFIEIASLISTEIVNCQQLACQAEPLPSWLARLVSLWHYGTADVLTLNYDLLIESALLTLRLRRNGRPMSPGDITRDLPPRVPRGGMWGQEPVTSFALRKLHGSTHWYGRPSNADLFSVVRSDTRIPVWGSPVPRQAENEETALLSALDPLILPPVSNKSVLYSNATIASLWRHARNALAGAAEVVIIGYSIPATDSSMLALLADTIQPAVPVVVIDKNADAVSENLNRIGIRNITQVDTPGTVGFSDLVHRLESDVAARVDLTEVGNLVAPVYAEVQADGTDRWPVTAIETATDGVSELIIGAEPKPPLASSVWPSPNPIALQANHHYRVRHHDHSTSVIYDLIVDRNGSDGSAVRLDISPAAR